MGFADAVVPKLHKELDVLMTYHGQGCEGKVVVLGLRSDEYYNLRTVALLPLRQPHFTILQATIF